MTSDIFLITPLDVLSWITFGFIVGLLVHTIRPLYNPRHIYKDIILAILGSMIAELTLAFFYGYIMLGTLMVSIVGGIILASGYVWFEIRTHQTIKNTFEKV